MLQSTGSTAHRLQELQHAVSVGAAHRLQSTGLVVVFHLQTLNPKGPRVREISRLTWMHIKVWITTGYNIPPASRSHRAKPRKRDAKVPLSK